MFEFHKIYSDSAVIDQVNEECRTAKIGCIDCKTFVADRVVAQLSPIWEARGSLEANPSRLDEVARAGRQRASKVSRQTLGEVKEAMKI